MSADHCLVFYGLSFDLADDEVKSCELRTDSKMQAAHAAGLDHYWGSFGVDRDRHRLFVGRMLGIFGPEHQSAMQFEPAALASIFHATNEKLNAAAFSGDPKLFIEYAIDQ